MSRKNLQSLRVLLLQIRDDPMVRLEEHSSFAKYTGLNIQQIDILNVFDTPQFEPTVIDSYDALFVGGASEASVLEPERYAFLEPSINLLDYCIEKNIPVFASCFGFQLATIALAGEVLKDNENYEMGTIKINLTQDAENDLLYKGISKSFLAVAVHKEKVLQVPSGCVELAYTEHCCHSFKVKDKLFWAFQFHPEVDKDTLVERLTFFREQYTENMDHLQSVLSSAKNTPESNALLKIFVDNILL